jgi:hypothetical protein
MVPTYDYVYDYFPVSFQNCANLGTFFLPIHIHLNSIVTKDDLHPLRERASAAGLTDVLTLL